MDVLKSVSAAGTAAVFTVTVIHPIDVVKTRLQISGEGTRNYKSLGSLGTIKVIASEEGIPAFWKGIGAAWLREASYTSLRLGLYGPIKKAMGVTNESSFFLKFTAGSLAGAIGSVVGNPFDVLKTQMMATEGTTKPSLVNSASKVYSTQGIAGFYRGMEANIMRAMVLNGTKMACYDTVKDLIKKSGVLPKGLATDFFAAFGAGFFMAVTVTPFDMIRTQLMNQKPGQEKLYNGFFDCVTKVVKNKGPLGLYAGFFPVWARFAPTTTLQLVIFEQIKPIFGVTGSGGGG
mmetsp:Transcript_24135/g.24725  ORF Transcript_24135/g.24725 Transcript_24135/m.24725 type:complete len:290 (-) Transcript_24135:376-1245(-)